MQQQQEIKPDMLSIRVLCAATTLLTMITSLALRIRRPLSSRIVQMSLFGTNQSTSSDLKLVRSLMEKDKIDAMVVPTDDFHMSEYTAPYFGRREFISRFTGSAGTAVITKEKALLFTDGRYHRQAEIELGPEWTLMRQGMQGVPTPVEYLMESLPQQSVVGLDPLVHSATAHQKLQSELKSRSICTKPLNIHPIDVVWGDRRPDIPVGRIREHPIEYAGQTIQEKFTEIRQLLTEHKTSALVVTMLDEIAWLLNIRGSDVECNPVAISYAILTQGITYNCSNILCTAHSMYHFCRRRISIYQQTEGAIGSGTPVDRRGGANSPI